MPDVNLNKATDSHCLNRLKEVITNFEFGLFLIGVSFIFVVFCSYMMYDRYAMLAEHCAQLEQENGELRTLLNVENLAGDDGQIKKELVQNYRKHLLQKYGN